MLYEGLAADHETWLIKSSDTSVKLTIGKTSVERFSIPNGYWYEIPFNYLIFIKLACGLHVCQWFTNDLSIQPDDSFQGRHQNKQLNDVILKRIPIGTFLYYNSKILRVYAVLHGLVVLCFNGHWVQHIYWTDLVHQYIFVASTKITMYLLKSPKCYFYESYTEMHNWQKKEHVLGFWNTNNPVVKQGLKLISPSSPNLSGWNAMSFLIYGTWDFPKVCDVMKLIQDHILANVDYWYYMFDKHFNLKQFVSNKQEFKSWVPIRYNFSKGLHLIIAAEIIDWIVITDLLNIYVLIFNIDKNSKIYQWKKVLDTRSFIGVEMEYLFRIIIHVYFKHEEWHIVHDPSITRQIKAINYKLKHPRISDTLRPIQYQSSDNMKEVNCIFFVIVMLGQVIQCPQHINFQL